MGILEFPPGAAFLSWPAANYVNPETRGWGSVVICSILTVVCLSTFSARIWARLFRSKNFGLDDWIMIAAVLPTLGLVVNLYLALRVYQFDRHLWDIDLNYSAMLKVTFADEILYIIAAALIKTSILIFYLRFTDIVGTTGYRYTIYASLVFVVLHLLIFTEESFLACVPFGETFDVTRPSAPGARRCVNGGTVAAVRNVLGVVQDFIAVLLPTFLFRNLDLPRAQKFALTGLLALGFVVCLAGMVRLGYFWEIYFTSWDWSWIGGEAFTWSTVECLLGIICASLPALKAFTQLPHSVAEKDNVPIHSPVHDSLWRKFSMNESGFAARAKERLSIVTREVGPSDTSSGTSRSKDQPYGGRRRSRVASVAPASKLR